MGLFGMFIGQILLQDVFLAGAKRVLEQDLLTLIGCDGLFGQNFDRLGVIGKAL
jgi:hypothetical protein